MTAGNNSNFVFTDNKAGPSVHKLERLTEDLRQEHQQ